MTKVIINFPIQVECDVASIDNATEAAFRMDKTDVAELTNIVFPSKLTVPASSIGLVSDS
jgi:hypothetical protein